MKSNIKKYGCVAAMLFYINLSFSQVSPVTKLLFIADSVKSGNAKDILTNFFQLGMNSITGPDKELSLHVNPFALMLKRNPRLSMDKYYKKYKPLRRLNLDMGVKFDSSFRFNGFSSGLKFSLIDQTDATTSKFVAMQLRTDPLGLERDVLTVALGEYLQTEITDPVEKQKFVLNINSFMQEDMPLNKMDAGFQKIVKEIVRDKKLDHIAELFKRKAGQSFRVADSLNYEKLKNSIKNNLLWTIGINDYTYEDKFQFAHVAIVSELSKGIFDPEPGANNLEVHVKAAYTFSNDTSRIGRNLKRELLTAESGINWVIRDRTTERAFCEIKFSGSYYHHFGTVYLNEQKQSLSINGTVRIRVLDDIWIPLEIKYDPKSGNVFGFLNIKANFTGLGKLLKAS